MRIHSTSQKAHKSGEFFTDDVSKCFFCGKPLHDDTLKQQETIITLGFNGKSHNAHNECFTVWQVAQKLLE